MFSLERLQMRMCRINQGVGRGGGKFPGDISINLGPWNELPSSTPGRFIIHPPTHPPIHAASQPLPAGPSVKCCGEYKDEWVKHTLLSRIIYQWDKRHRSMDVCKSERDRRGLLSYHPPATTTLSQTRKLRSREEMWLAPSHMARE